MKQHFAFIALTAVCMTTSATAGELPANSTNGNSSPSLIAQAQPESSRPKQKNYVSITSSFGRVLKGEQGVSDQSINEYGITGKIGVADNISIRPFISAGTESSRVVGNFGSANLEFTNATVGVAATYDLNLSNSDFTPYGGLGYSSSIAKANLVGSNQSLIERTTSGVYLEVGTDYQLPDSRIVLNANYKLQDGGGLFGISVGYGF